MFLSVEWAKRWLPAVFLLLSLFLPWTTMIYRPTRALVMSFPWGNRIELGTSKHFSSVIGYYTARFYLIPYLCLVTVSITIGGLCGLSSKIRTRTLGGLLGIIGIISYFIFVYHETAHSGWLPFFEITYWKITFLSVGFYLALAGSLMLLLSLIRTIVEELRKLEWVVVLGVIALGATLLFIGSFFFYWGAWYYLFSVGSRSAGTVCVTIGGPVIVGGIFVASYLGKKLKSRELATISLMHLIVALSLMYLILFLLDLSVPRLVSVFMPPIILSNITLDIAFLIGYSKKK